MSTGTVVFVVLAISLILIVLRRRSRAQHQQRTMSSPAPIRSALKETSGVRQESDTAVSDMYAARTQDEEANPTPAELVEKFWPNDGQSSYEQARTTLKRIDESTNVDWEYDAEDDDPSPTDCVTALRSKGCSDVDLIAALYSCSSYRLAKATTDVMAKDDVTVAVLAEACRLGSVKLDADELDDLLNEGLLDIPRLFQLSHELELSCSQLMKHMEESSQWEYDLHEIVTPARHADYTDDEIMTAIWEQAEDVADACEEALVGGLPYETLVKRVRDAGCSVESIEYDLSDSELTTTQRIDFLYHLIHSGE